MPTLSNGWKVECLGHVFDQTPDPTKRYKTIGDSIQAACETKSYAKLGQLFLDILQIHPSFTFYMIETYLRYHDNDDIWLLAVPKRNNDFNKFLCCHPTKNVNTEHYLWICTSGVEEFDAKRLEFGIGTYSQNIENLQKCGVQIIDPASNSGHNERSF